MKTHHVSGFGTTAGVFMAVAFAAMCPHSLAQPNTTSPQGKPRVGIYDSRAVAVAYAGSAAHTEQTRALREAHRKAKEAGDTKKIAQLQTMGKAMQQKLHSQGFSTNSVEDLILSITNSLPEIKKSAGVTDIVSKWDPKAAQLKQSGSELVDITTEIVDAFKPSEQQRKRAMEIQKHAPISLEQAAAIED